MESNGEPLDLREHTLTGTLASALHIEEMFFYADYPKSFPL